MICNIHMSNFFKPDFFKVTISRNLHFFQPLTLALQMVIILKINIFKNIYST